MARTEDDADYTAGFNQLYPRHYAFLGYPLDVVEARVALLESLYGSAVPAPFAEGLRDLQSLERPLAIHFSDANSAFLAWLGREGIGRQLARDGNEVVWFVEAKGGGRS